MNRKLHVAIAIGLLLGLVSAGCPARRSTEDGDNGGPGVEAAALMEIVDRGTIDATRDFSIMGLAPQDAVTATVVGSSGSPVKFHVNWTDGGEPAGYDALVGPGGGGSVGPDGSFDMNNAWGLFIGRWPFIRTKRVSAGVEGSWLLVEIDGVDDATAIHRVYFVEGIEAWLRTEGGEELRWRDTDIYFEIDSKGLVSIKNVSTNTKAKSFVNFVKKAAEAANYGKPPTTQGPVAGDDISPDSPTTGTPKSLRP